MAAKKIYGVDSCHFCKRGYSCPHYGEEGFVCTSHTMSYPDDSASGGDTDLGVSYAAEIY